jgi:hypothetical protein
MVVVETHGSIALSEKQSGSQNAVKQSGKTVLHLRKL